MFKIEKNIPSPSRTDNSRVSRHSVMNAMAQRLKPDESFEVVCADEKDRIATHKALHRFKIRNGLDGLLIMKTGEKTFRVWGQ